MLFLIKPKTYQPQKGANQDQTVKALYCLKAIGQTIKNPKLHRAECRALISHVLIVPIFP